MRTVKRTKISNEALRRFVVTWVEAADRGLSQEWIASELSMSKDTVVKRGRFLKSRGVKLPKLVPNMKPVDVDGLNDLIKNSK